MNYYKHSEEQLLSINEIREEVKKRLGIKLKPENMKEGLSDSLINYYVDMGLIPRPQRRAFEDGKRGVRNYFPEKTVDLIVKIKKLTEGGYSLAVIKDKLQKESIKSDNELTEIVKLIEIDSKNLPKIVSVEKNKQKALEIIDDQIRRYEELRQKII